MSQIALARNDHGHPGYHRGRNPQQIRVKIMRMNNLEPASPQKNRQAQHLINPSDRIHPTLGIKLANRDRRASQSLEQRTACAQATQSHIVALGVEPGRQLNRLRLSATDIQGVEQEKNFSPGRGRARQRGAALRRWSRVLHGQRLRGRAGSTNPCSFIVTAFLHSAQAPGLVCQRRSRAGARAQT